MESTRQIRIRGAREHNLRSLDVDIPRDQLVVITGVSGSGKSSLAFDTIYAEGQRKYMESLSAYARQFLDQFQKPDVESIEGLPPTIAIEQRCGGHNPRSTVATTTEIYDYLRLLFARCGSAACWAVIGGTPAKPRRCGKPISATSATQIVDAIMAMIPGTRIMVAAPVVRGKKGFHADVVEGLQRHGFVRARVNGTLVDLREALKDGGGKGADADENPLKLARYEQHTIEAIVDRVVVSPEVRSRLADSVEVALRLAEGSLVVLAEEVSGGGGGGGGWTEHRYSDKLACGDHPECALEELSPRMFSFNSPYGACPACDGLGQVSEFDESLIVPDPSLGISGGAVEPWRHNGRRMNIRYSRALKRFCTSLGVDGATAWSDLPAAAKRVLLNGTTEADEAKLGFSFEGVLPDLRRRYRHSDSDFVKEKLREYMSDAPCERCGGARLREESLHVRVTGAGRSLNIAEATALTIGEATRYFGAMELDTEQRKIAEPILREINARLGFLASVGLDYLTLDRTARTLSAGEAQRIRLATQVGSGLVGVCYVLDEPTIGLHHRDNQRLIGTLRHLQRIGNTVLVVEHDEEMIRAADHLIDIGPGPGRHGGTVAGQGSIAEVCAEPGSQTGAYLSGRRAISVPARRRELDEGDAIVVKGARQNNLKDIDAAFPLGGLVCVTGVSGSGKSTLVNEILYKGARRELLGSREAPGDHRRINGLKRLERVIQVDQSPIGRTPRSNPATYTGIFDEIRRLFAKTKEARIRGYEPGRFSFNVKGGRCESCQGQGVKKIEMHFLPDVFVTCEACKGKRYNRETLEITYRHKTIADVLLLPVETAIGFFDAHRRIKHMLECLRDVGLEYVELGQPSTTLSGGEAQRIKLAAELGLATAGRTLYILDEPTTGLHFADVEKLMSVFERLAAAGHTLVVIEHNLDVIKCADWILDLGPEGGDRGGTIVAAGPPEAIVKVQASYTGRALAPLLRTGGANSGAGGGGGGAGGVVAGGKRRKPRSAAAALPGAGAGAEAEAGAGAR